MDLKLEPLRTSDLTNMGAGQLIRRHLDDFGTIDPALLIDQPFNSYRQQLGGLFENYQKGLAQVQKNEDTHRIFIADLLRDKDVRSVRMAIKLHLSSDDPEEVEAARSLSILLSAYKNVTTSNYEEETLALDKLTSELNSEAYSGKISLLHMEKYVTRLQNDNANFNELFSGRNLTNALTESYDLKVIRKEMLKNYNQFTAYVLSMAQALNTPLFLTALNMLNSTRKYYADQLARHTTDKEDKVKTEA